MMKKTMLIAILSIGLQLCSHSVWAQSTSQLAKMIIGKCQRSDLDTSQQFNAAYRLHYNDYQPDSSKIKALKQVLQNTTVHIVFGTWCGDSKLQVPRFLKMMDAIHFPAKNITYEGVDYSKKTTQELGIERVPTFIFYKNGKEIYRLVERPTVSLESDILEHIH